MGVYRSFILDDIDFATRVNVLSIERDLMPPVYDDLLYVRGRSGAYDTNGGQDDVLYITMLIEVTNENGSGTLRDKARELASLLRRKEVKQLICGDEPDKFNLARVSGRTEWKEIANMGTGKIVFLCLDPFAYSIDEHETEFTNDVATVENAGTQETYPRIVAAFTAPSTFLMLSAPDKRLLLGDPSDVEQTPIPAEELILHDACATTTGWTTGIATPDGGVRAGTMISSGGKFVVSDYGVGAAWHGPTLKRSLPGAVQLQDFQVEILSEQNNIGAAKMGRVEIYLLDAADNVIGKMAMKDIWSNIERNAPEARAGSHAAGRMFLEYIAAYNFNWKFQAAGAGYIHYLRISRQGQLWRAQAAWRMPDVPSFWNIQRASFVDVEEQYQTKLAQICVHLGKRDPHIVTPHSINDIKVYRLNEPGLTQIPYIANTGDIIEVDHATGRVRRNGQDAMSLYAVGTDFFAMPPGETELTVQPTGRAGVKLYHRDCWK